VLDRRSFRVRKLRQTCLAQSQVEYFVSCQSGLSSLPSIFHASWDDALVVKALKVTNSQIAIFDLDSVVSKSCKSCCHAARRDYVISNHLGTTQM
jgi:hypothetical protein